MRASCGNLIDFSLVKLWGLGNRLRLPASQLLDLIHLLDFKVLTRSTLKKILSGCLSGFATVFLCDVFGM